MGNIELNNRILELANKWRHTKEVRYIQEAIRLANQIKEGRVEAFLAILHALAGNIQQNGSYEVQNAEITSQIL